MGEPIEFNRYVRIHPVNSWCFIHRKDVVSSLNTALSFQRLDELKRTRPLYIVKADAEDCYGNVNHSALKGIINHSWPEGRQGDSGLPCSINSSLAISFNVPQWLYNTNNRLLTLYSTNFKHFSSTKWIFRCWKENGGREWSIYCRNTYSFGHCVRGEL